MSVYRCPECGYEFDEASGMVYASWDGYVEMVPASGDLRGMFFEVPVERISGSWEGTAPDVAGTGSGQWSVSR